MRGGQALQQCAEFLISSVITWQNTRVKIKHHLSLVLSGPFSLCRVPLPKRFLLIGPCSTVSGLVKWKQDSQPHFQYPLEVNICLSRWEEIKQTIQHKQRIPWQTVICLQRNNLGHQSNQHFFITGGKATKSNLWWLVFLRLGIGIFVQKCSWQVS